MRINTLSHTLSSPSSSLSLLLFYFLPLLYRNNPPISLALSSGLIMMHMQVFMSTPIQLINKQDLQCLGILKYRVPAQPPPTHFFTITVRRCLFPYPSILLIPFDVTGLDANLIKTTSAVLSIFPYPTLLPPSPFHVALFVYQ